MYVHVSHKTKREVASIYVASIFVAQMTYVQNEFLNNNGQLNCFISNINVIRIIDILGINTSTLLLTPARVVSLTICRRNCLIDK